VLPLALKAGELDEADYLSNDELIFPYLDGYNMGVPAEQALFDEYLAALTKAYKKLHSIQIVHFDGYPSNIMWKKAGETPIEVKLIDFDCAVWLSKPLPGKIIDNMRLNKYQQQIFYWNNTSTATAEHDAWFAFIYSRMTPEERFRSQESKANANGVNIVYQATVNRLNTAGDIRNEFQLWFASVWTDTTTQA
jgi:serine/threonine protein kinase